jgi:hypothetical protein
MMRSQRWPKTSEGLVDLVRGLWLISMVLIPLIKDVNIPRPVAPDSSAMPVKFAVR